MSDVRSGRLAVPSWLQPRIALGVLLVVGSVAIGARALSSADRYSEVLIARHPLVPGEQLVGADLGVSRIRFAGSGSAYLAGSSIPVGYVVTRYVGTGELVPAAALSSTPSTVAASRTVAIPVAVGHLPLDLARGDAVDVYLTPKSSGGTSGKPVLVLSAAPVDEVSGGDAVGADDDESVVLDVPQDKVLAVISATEGGAVDLVRVPDVGGGGS